MPDRTLTADQLAKLVGGQLLGDGGVPIAGVAPLDRATRSDLSFLASGRYLPYFQRTSAGAVLLTPEFRDVAAGPATRIVVEDPHRALATTLGALFPEHSQIWGVAASAVLARGVHWQGRIAIGERVSIGSNVSIGRDCVIDPGTVIEADVELGDYARIGPHCVVHTGSKLGNRVVLKAGARVGSPGFGFATDDGAHQHIKHIGRCEIGNDVEIGANTTVDRGSIADTVVGNGTKIDNLVHVGHNVRIGERCLIMAQVGVAGSTVVGDDVILAGQAGLADNLTVGSGARIAAQAGVIGDIPPGATVSGYPARHHRDVLRQAASMKRLARLTPVLERIAKAHDRT